MRIVVAITGASGAIYGTTLLEELEKRKIETHLIISTWGKRIVELETVYSFDCVSEKASFSYGDEDMAAPPASGSFLHQGMVIAPCSMKTLAAITHGWAESLITRAADVTIKEKRPLILLPRETPFSPIHLENMLKLARLGVIIMPPIPAFYTRPETIQDLVNHLAGRVLDLLGIENNLVRRWPK
ncbi:MAG: UbiX family flavin prenyltransferase [Peptococcaceae bacterium]